MNTPAGLGGWHAWVGGSWLQRESRGLFDWAPGSISTRGRVGTKGEREGRCQLNTRNEFVTLGTPSPNRTGRERALLGPPEPQARLREPLGPRRATAGCLQPHAEVASLGRDGWQRPTSHQAPHLLLSRLPSRSPGSPHPSCGHRDLWDNSPP